MISNGIRYFEMKYPINYEAVIKIYQSCRKNLLLFLCCMLFAVGGVYLITDEDESCRFVIKFIVCWLSLIFFGGVGSFLGVTTLYNAINRISYLIIYDDRVEHYVQFKAGYNTIYLADIKSFRLIKINSTMQIAIDYKDACLLKKMKSRSTSGIVKKLMVFNFYVTGAMETIYVSNLRMNRDGICHL